MPEHEDGFFLFGRTYYSQEAIKRVIESKVAQATGLANDGNVEGLWPVIDGLRNYKPGIMFIRGLSEPGSPGYEMSPFIYGMTPYREDLGITEEDLKKIESTALANGIPVEIEAAKACLPSVFHSSEESARGTVPRFGAEELMGGLRQSREHTQNVAKYTRRLNRDNEWPAVFEMDRGIHVIQAAAITEMLTGLVEQVRDWDFAGKSSILPRLNYSQGEGAKTQEGLQGEFKETVRFASGWAKEFRTTVGALVNSEVLKEFKAAAKKLD